MTRLEERISRVVVFDSPLRENLFPFTLTKPSFNLICGTDSLLEGIRRSLGSPVTDLIVPKYLEALSRETNKETVNEEIEDSCLVVNGLLKPTFPLSSELQRLSDKRSDDFWALDAEGNIVFGITQQFDSKKLASHEIPDNQKQLIEGKPLFYYPWELVSENSASIIASKYEYSSANHPFEVLGSKLHLSSSASVERFVTIDTRSGPVIIDDGAVIQSFSHITGPAYIGKNSIIKSGKIRQGTTIGIGCRISGEVEESIFCHYSNKNHDGFIGHSIIGSWANLGALTTNSDLKNTYGTIKVRDHLGKEISTGLTKVGCFIGDMVKTSIGTMIYSGKSIGTCSQALGEVFEDVPSFTMYARSLGKESKELYFESALETQSRVMARRGVTISQSYSEMMKSVQQVTEKDRMAASVKKGKFELV